MILQGEGVLILMSSVCTKGQYTTALPVYNLIISGLAANNNYNGIAPPHTLISLPRGVLFSALAILRGGLCLSECLKPGLEQTLSRRPHRFSVGKL